jgi:hypothetical protein
MSYSPIDTGIPIEITNMEYFGDEQNCQDHEEIVSDQSNPLQLLGNFEGTWDGELDTVVSKTTQWLYNDRPFHKDYRYQLVDVSNYDIIGKMPEVLGFVPGCYRAQIQLQRPGCVMPRHRDPPEMFGSIPKNLRDQGVRVLIMLAPWEYGQIMCFNNQVFTEWTKGSIITCDFQKVWHFTANCSYHSRPLLQISGLPNNQLIEHIKNRQNHIFNV